MRRALLVFVVLCAAGCPGQRRPPPRVDAAKPSPRAGNVDPPSNGPSSTSVLADLEQEVAALDAETSSFSGDAEAWKRLIARIDAARIDLEGKLETEQIEGEEGPEIDALYGALEKLQVVRNALVQRQPN